MTEGSSKLRELAMAAADWSEQCAKTVRTSELLDPLVTPLDPDDGADVFVSYASLVRCRRLLEAISRLGCEMAYEATPLLRVILETSINMAWIFEFSDAPKRYADHFLLYEIVAHVAFLESLPEHARGAYEASRIEEYRRQRDELAKPLRRRGRKGKPVSWAKAHWAGVRDQIRHRAADVATLPQFRDSHLRSGDGDGSVFNFFFGAFSGPAHADARALGPLFLTDRRPVERRSTPLWNPLLPMRQGAWLTLQLFPYVLERVPSDTVSAEVGGLAKGFEALEERWGELYGRPS